jgi:predicted RNase H-like nuclease (RuvC/YqgF family)
MDKFLKSASFKYLKNFIIGVGAAVVMLGALGKINSEPWGGLAITIGLATEAFIFCLLGILPPEKDYYWEKLYPGLDRYNAKISPLTEGEIGDEIRPINGEIVEGQLGGMLSELQTMSKSLSSLKALQEVDFSQTSDQIKTMGNFYERMNVAMKELSASVEDTKVVRTNLAALNENLNNVNMVYRSVAESKNHVTKINDSMKQLSETAEDAAQYKSQLTNLNENMRSLNNVYGSVLSAMGGKK